MRRVIIILFLILFCSSFIYASFEVYGWGTRAAALGGAYVALADDPSGPFYNPSCIAYMERAEASFMYSGLLTGMDMDSSLSVMRSGTVIINENIGNMAFNWARFRVSSLYSEDTFVLTYANNMNNFKKSFDKNLSAGINIKIFKSRFQLYDDSFNNDPVFQEGNSKSTFGIDAGIMYRIGKRKKDYKDYRVGLSVLNINKPDIGLMDKDIIPMQIKGGFFYPISVKNNFLKNLQINRSIVAFSLSYVDSSDINVHVGMENIFFKDLLHFRFGGNLNEVGGGLGIQYALKKIEMLFNYTFLYPLKVKSTSGTHRTSLSVRF